MVRLLCSRKRQTEAVALARGRGLGKSSGHSQCGLWLPVTQKPASECSGQEELTVPGPGARGWGGRWGTEGTWNSGGGGPDPRTPEVPNLPCCFPLDSKHLGQLWNFQNGLT